MLSYRSRTWLVLQKSLQKYFTSRAGSLSFAVFITFKVVLHKNNLYLAKNHSGTMHQTDDNLKNIRSTSPLILREVFQPPPHSSRVLNYWLIWKSCYTVPEEDDPTCTSVGLLQVSPAYRHSQLQPSGHVTFWFARKDNTLVTVFECFM